MVIRQSKRRQSARVSIERRDIDKNLIKISVLLIRTVIRGFKRNIGKSVQLKSPAKIIAQLGNFDSKLSKEDRRYSFIVLSLVQGG